MKKSFLVFLVTIGTVIGSGFLSGKEIVVFFTRFGSVSFLCIPLAFFAFWGMFYFTLSWGGRALEKLKKSKLSNLVNIFLCVILCGAMFSGSYEIISFAGKPIAFIGMTIILIFCFYIIKHGIGFLEKVNLFMVPVMVILLVVFDIVLLHGAHVPSVTNPFSSVSGFYALAYVAFNTSNSGVLLAHLGKDLSKKQKARVSFFAALVLSLVLLLSNIVLLENSASFNQEMPLLSLFDGWQKAIMQIVIALGCVTTLFSLIFTLAGSLRGLIASPSLSGRLSVFVPLALSLWGFGNIVTYLYPISSVLSLLLLSDLFFVPALKQAYQAIHNRR